MLAIMDLDRQTCDRARRSRDARFDGRFFIAVTSTGIYCRPICPARSPKDENIRYYPTAAAAEAAGFRPCLRCRPEASPGTPAWAGTSSVVSRALRLIGEGALDREGVEQLSDRLGITARHLRRLFVQHLGATPVQVALTRRAHFAKKLLDETPLALIDVAMASGFGSVRRFNAEIRRTFSRTPTELRRRRAAPRSVTGDGCYRFRLSYRPPYDWEACLAFLAARATPGVEAVERSRYRRTIAINGNSGTIEIRRVDLSCSVDLEVSFPDSRPLLAIVERVRRMFDLTADPTLIEAHLRGDRLIREHLRAHAGIRVPGSWDGFELAVRAILGQQVSVRGATTLAGRVAERFGTPTTTAAGLTRLFPTPEQLADAPIEEAGVIGTRAAGIRLLAQKVRSGALTLGASADSAATTAALCGIHGIGAWTAQYIAMRACGEPDAFPGGDLVLRRMAGGLSPRALEERSQQWRPWRAYAVMLLWQGAVDETDRSRRMRHAHISGSFARAGVTARAERRAHSAP